jgi:hypothetical protein
MKSISENLKIETTNLRSERAFVLSEFIKEINLDRVGTKYKPVDVKGVAIKTSHLSLKDLRDFYHQCWRGKIEGKYTFSQIFYGALKIK